MFEESKSEEIKIEETQSVFSVHNQMREADYKLHIIIKYNKNKSKELGKAEQDVTQKMIKLGLKKMRF